MTISCDICKEREIVFHHIPDGQVKLGVEILSTLPGLEVWQHDSTTLQVRYCLGDYTLEDLESVLAEQGLHIESSLHNRLKRAVVYYAERVQVDNMDKPEVHTKNYKAHVEAWEKRPHGDHDETPEVWRQYK